MMGPKVFFVKLLDKSVCVFISNKEICSLTIFPQPHALFLTSVHSEVPENPQFE